jgi:hypothetical protein
VEIVSLVGETFLQSRSAGLVKANVQDQFFGHGFSIPEGLDPAGSETKLV